MNGMKSKPNYVFKLWVECLEQFFLFETKLGVQHGEVAALLPWEAVAAPAENTALDPPTQENPVQIPQPGG